MKCPINCKGTKDMGTTYHRLEDGSVVPCYLCSWCGYSETIHYFYDSTVQSDIIYYFTRREYSKNV